MRFQGLTLGIFTASAVTVAASTLECTTCAISRILPSASGATVNYVKRVPLNGSFTGSAKDTFAPSTYTGLPSLCAVSVNVPSPGNTSFNFGLFLPDGWNGRLITTGNGGFGGGVNWVCPGLLAWYLRPARSAR